MNSGVVTMKNNNKEIDFDAAKREFVSCYSPKLIETLILKDLSKKHQVSEKTLEELAMCEKWPALRDKKNQKILDLEALEETEVRADNFKIGTLLQDKGWQKLSQANLEDITVDQAIKMIQFGLKARHDAAGMPKKYDAFSHIYPQPGEQTAEEAIIEQRYYKLITDDLAAYIIKEKAKEQESKI
jgi:hypothetical protein